MKSQFDLSLNSMDGLPTGTLSLRLDSMYKRLIKLNRNFGGGNSWKAIRLGFGQYRWLPYREGIYTFASKHNRLVKIHTIFTGGYILKGNSIWA